MFKVNVEKKELVKLNPTNFYDLGLLERFDIQEWIEKTPEILGEELLIIAKEKILNSGIRLDLLAIDKKARLVIIELKRDDSGSNVEWQAIKYASYCSIFLHEDIYSYYAEYLHTDTDEAQLLIEEFIDEELEILNQEQLIVLVAKEFHPDVISAVLWLRDFGVDLKCVRLRPYLDSDNELFITPDIIIPLPEAKDYIEKKEIKQKEIRTSSYKSSFSLEVGNFDIDELSSKLIQTLSRPSELTPRLIAFFEILLSEDRPFDREEIKERLLEKGIGTDIGQTGRYLSNVSQFFTKKSTPHLRQLVTFETGGAHGETKDNYYLIQEYRLLVEDIINGLNS